MPEGPGRVLVIGAGMAGGRTCEALRAAGYDGKITLVGAEEHPPYDRPPLSKAALSGEADTDTSFGHDFDALAIRAILGTPALELDRASRTVHTEQGDLVYDALVLATGAAPTRVPGTGPQVCLRTREDAAALRSALVPGSRVVLVGAGWIGAEVATAALAAGCTVVALEAAAAPLAGPLGEQVAARLLPWWEGVELRTSVLVEEVVDAGVRLAGGELIGADVVVTGVGVRPVTGWLEGSGLELIDRAGVAVDGDRRTSDPAVFAVGDVASRFSPRVGGRVAGGHWDEAVNGPAAAAAAIMGSPRGIDEVPYFWSDQFGRKIQYVGQHHAADQVVFREHEDPAKWGVAWVSNQGRISAHLNIGFPRAMVRARAAIEAGHVVDLEALKDLTYLS